jgi:hypothetical protein
VFKLAKPVKNISATLTVSSYTTARRPIYHPMIKTWIFAIPGMTGITLQQHDSVVDDKI